MKILNALSVRPRTLPELSDITGISVQGVIRHLKILEGAAIVKEERVHSKVPKARIVYVASGEMVGDYSTGDLTVVRAVERGGGRQTPGPSAGLERMAGDVIVQRRRVREETKRLARTIDELVGYQDALETALKHGSFTDAERLILEVLFTEETLEDGVRALDRYYGVGDRRSIEEALGKARQSVK